MRLASAVVELQRVLNGEKVRVSTFTSGKILYESTKSCLHDEINWWKIKS
jgi:hypothetical protein